MNKAEAKRYKEETITIISMIISSSKRERERERERLCANSQILTVSTDLSFLKRK